MIEVALASFPKLGLVAVDEEGNRLWQYDHKIDRLYGLDVDPVSGNIYYGTWHKLIEITRLGNKVWEFSHSNLKDIHTIDVIGSGRILVTSANKDRILEIDKKRGIVNEWYAGDYFPKPNLPPNSDWTHLNSVRKLKDGGMLITMLMNPDQREGGEALRVDKLGQVVWRWTDASRKSLNGCHALVPFREHYLLGESNGQRISEIDESGKIYKVFNTETAPHEIEVIDEHRILVASTSVKPKNPKPRLLWIKWDEEEVKSYEPPENVDSGFSVKFVLDWSVDPDPSEKREIMKKLREFGYI